MDAKVHTKPFAEGRKPMENILLKDLFFRPPIVFYFLLEYPQITWFLWWPKTLKSKLNLKGEYEARVHSGQMVLVVVRQGGWTMLTVAKGTQRRIRKWLEEAKGPT